jgi:hypothetical protein
MRRPKLGLGPRMASELRDEIANAARESPCNKADDLFAPPARRVIGRILKDFLAKNKLTVTELLHRADMLDRVEATGTLYQFVVQQTAVARASSEKRPVQQIIRELNKLGSDLYDQVHQDQRSKLFRDLEAEDFDSFAADLTGQPRAAYRLNGTLARHLRDATTWGEKAERLMRVLELSRPDLPGRAVLTAAVDSIFAEVLTVPMAVLELIEPRDTFGEAVMAMVHLFLGRADSILYKDLYVIPRLAWHFSLGTLPLSRAAVAGQILAQIYSLERLRSDTLDNEMRVFKQITDLVMGGLDDTLRREDAVPALELRSKRFVVSEAISVGLSNSVLPDERIDWLLFAENCVVGAMNKQALADVAIRIATADSFKTQFQLTSTALPKRLQRLAALSTAVQRSGFHENDRKKLAAVFDAVAFALARDTKLFETIEARPGSAVEKALALLQLCEDHTFTEGRLSEKVRDAIVGYMASPGFLAGYTERSRGTKENALAELTQRVSKIGLTPQNVRELIAA